MLAGNQLGFWSTEVYSCGFDKSRQVATEKAKGQELLNLTAKHGHQTERVRDESGQEKWPTAPATIYNCTYFFKHD